MRYIIFYCYVLRSFRTWAACMHHLTLTPQTFHCDTHTHPHTSARVILGSLLPHTREYIYINIHTFTLNTTVSSTTAHVPHRYFRSMFPTRIPFFSFTRSYLKLRPHKNCVTRIVNIPRVTLHLCSAMRTSSQNTKRPRERLCPSIRGKTKNRF